MAAYCVAGFAVGTAGASETVLRYRCVLIDGSVQVVARDLSVAFPATVRQCSAVGAPPLASSGTREPLLARLTPPASSDGGPLLGLGNGDTGWNSRLPADISVLIERACRRYRLSPSLVQALMYVESRFQPRAQSPKGALGLMQVMPRTGARYGVSSPRDLLEPSVNVEVGAHYLHDLHGLFNDRVDLILAAYNAGEGAVARHGNRVPPYPETQAYVAKIMALMRSTTLGSR